MPQDLKRLYESFDAYVVRLNADREKAREHLPQPRPQGLFEKIVEYFRRPRKHGLQIQRLSFAEFCDFWQRVSADPIELYRWTRRLSPGGYEGEQEAIRRGLSRTSGAGIANEREPAPPERRAA